MLETNHTSGLSSGSGYTMTNQGTFAFCYACVMAVKLNLKIRSLGAGDLAFVSHGCSNWKDATGEKGAFNIHQKSSTHKTTIEVMITLPASTGNVGEMLSRAHAQERLLNRDYLLKVFQNIQFLARQGIALRGHDEQNSNFIQLLHLWGLKLTNTLVIRYKMKCFK